MANKERDINYYRKFFIDPQKPVDPSFVDTTVFIANQLLGKPNENPGDIASQNWVFSNFTKELINRMKTSRHFDDRSLGQLHPNGFIPGILAHEASTYRNNNTVAYQSSPAETQMECETINWLIENIAGYPAENASGALTIGGTLSNLSAIFVARERLIHHKNWDGRSPATVLTSEMAHYSVRKAARILGPNGLISTTSLAMENGGYKTDIEALKNKVYDLKKQKTPIMAIVALAGQTETGLVDNLDEISCIAKENDIYLHVDGAYGAPFVLSSRNYLFKGIEQSDSLTIDPHKYLYTPYPAGSILFNNSSDKEFIMALNKEGEDYILGEPIGDHLGKGRIEGSMGGQGAAALLSTIRTLGKDGLKIILDHTVNLTNHAHNIINDSKSVFKPAYNPELNTLSFYPKNITERQDVFIEKAVTTLEERTGIYISTESLPLVNEPLDTNGNIKKSRVFRMVTTHPYTTTEIINEALDNLTKIWYEIIFDSKKNNINN